MTKKQNHVARKVVGSVAAAAAVAGAAYYFLGSEKAKEHRKKVGGWINKAKKEIASEAKKLSKAALNEQTYRKIASTVLDKYQDVQSLTKKEISQLSDILAKEWKQLRSKPGANSKKTSNKKS